MKLVASYGINVSLLLTVYLQLAHTSLTIVHRLKKTTVYNSSDEIQVKRVPSEDGTNVTSSFMLISEPLEACQIPTKPPEISREKVKTTRLEKEIRWTLLVTAGGGCDLKTKILNAAQANFSHVIVKNTGLDDVLGYQDLTEDPDVDIDVSLLTSTDWDTITAFTHPKPYVCSTECSSKKGDTEGVWIDSIIFSTVYALCCIIFDILRGTFGLIYATVVAILVIPTRWDEFITSDHKEGLAVVIILSAVSAPFVFIAYFAKTSKKYEREEKRKNEKVPDWSSYRWEWNREDDSEDEETQHNRAKKLKVQLKLTPWLKALELTVPIDDLIIAKEEEADLIIRKVEKAFRSLASIHHPDKHQNVDEQPMKQITARFQRIEAAKRSLMEYFEKQKRKLRT